MISGVDYNIHEYVFISQWLLWTYCVFVSREQAATQGIVGESVFADANEYWKRTGVWTWQPEKPSVVCALLVVLATGKTLQLHHANLYYLAVSYTFFCVLCFLGIHYSSNVYLSFSCRSVFTSGDRASVAVQHRSLCPDHAAMWLLHFSQPSECTGYLGLQVFL